MHFSELRGLAPLGILFGLANYLDHLLSLRTTASIPQRLFPRLFVLMIGCYITALGSGEPK
jgi:hypothetical protein